MAMVVMDKEDYINKAKELLGQQVYKKLDKDPTHRIKAKLITNSGPSKGNQTGWRYI